ncbi:Crp/Fnr family transcriptional regulator [Legionella hackeliae]|uniref:cAMP-binding protein n=1 Tax=Legionella hackeliae TaxID=449 RepID=A0A0A8USP6_LEGHA|nr:cyclic nucleotide-binding domain-containing protein [Legionella hackeliae]KTD10577.1 cNMP binding domain-containing protein [Legionella hackeliae]CEK10082.1 cAMP-binding protein [Legionella hackeliae]STX46806.1 cNMP binding domain-containing protein [Legionella hackeliae]
MVDSGFLDANNAHIKSLLNQLEVSNLGQYLNQDELAILIKHSKIINFLPGEVILKQGKQATGIYVIIEGQVTTTARVMGQGITTIESLGPGSFLGEICFIEKIPCPTSAVADAQVRCLLINETYFELLSAYYPEIKYKLLDALSRQVCGRLRRMHDKVTDYMTDSNMISLSFFGKVAYTFNQPKALPLEENLRNTLLETPPFNLFTKDEQQELFNNMELIEASKNCKLIYQGKQQPICYIVIKGAVQSSMVHDNKQAKLSVIGPGTLFAGVACIDNDSSYTVTFSTCEQALLLKITDTSLKHFQEEHPSLWYKLFTLICASLVALEKSIDKLDIRLHIETYNR